MVSKDPFVMPILLNKNQKIEIPIYRVFPDVLCLALEFDKKTGDARSELGSSISRGHSKELGYIEYNNPGDPIKISAQIQNKQVVYEAMPANATHPRSTRNLIPFIDDGYPNRIPWQPDVFLDVPSGNSTLLLTVIEVGQKIQGETATLIVRQPLNFAGAGKNYRHYIWFYFWPVYVAILCFYFIILLCLSFYKKSSLD